MKRLREILEQIPDIENFLKLILRCKRVTIAVEVDEEELEGDPNESLQNSAET